MLESIADLSLTLGEGITLIVTGVATALALFLGWWFLKGRIRWILARLEEPFPADLSGLIEPASKVVIFVLSAVILTISGFVIASTLGLDVTGAVETIGDGALTVAPHVLRIVLILLIAEAIIYAVIRVIPPLVRQALSRRSGERRAAGEVQKRARTLEVVLSALVGVAVWLMAGFVVLAELGVNIAPLLAGAGILGIAVGFGAQSLIKDFLSGIFVLLEDQYRVGDVVRVAGVAGIVEDFNLRRTTLRDLDFIQHIIPNGEVRVASNFTKEKSRVNMNIQVAYRTDLDHAIAVLNRVGKEMSEDPEWSPLITDPLKVLRVDAFEESGIAIKVLGETLPIRQWDVAGQFRLRVKRAFDEEGIEIPFPHRTIYWGTGPGAEARVRVTSEDDNQIPTNGLPSPMDRAEAGSSNSPERPRPRRRKTTPKDATRSLPDEE